MTIFRFSLCLSLAALAGCEAPFQHPANEIEASLDGSVHDVIARLDQFIDEYEGREAELEDKLLKAGFSKEEFEAEPYTLNGEAKMRNCQFYRRTKKGWLGMGSSAIVWLCEEGSGANLGYVAP